MRLVQDVNLQHECGLHRCFFGDVWFIETDMANVQFRCIGPVVCLRAVRNTNFPRLWPSSSLIVGVYQESTNILKWPMEFQRFISCSLLLTFFDVSFLHLLGHLRSLLFPCHFPGTCYSMVILDPCLMSCYCSHEQRKPVVIFNSESKKRGDHCFSGGEGSFACCLPLHQLHERRHESDLLLIFKKTSKAYNGWITITQPYSTVIACHRILKMFRNKLFLLLGRGWNCYDVQLLRNHCLSAETQKCHLAAYWLPWLRPDTLLCRAV